MPRFSTIQRVNILAGISGASYPTAAKFLRGEAVKGQNLTMRLQEAKKQLEAMEAAPPSPANDTATAAS